MVCFGNLPSSFSYSMALPKNSSDMVAEKLSFPLCALTATGLTGRLHAKDGGAHTFKRALDLPSKYGKVVGNRGSRSGMS